MTVRSTVIAQIDLMLAVLGCVIIISIILATTAGETETPGTDDFVLVRAVARTPGAGTATLKLVGASAVSPPVAKPVVAVSSAETIYWWSRISGGAYFLDLDEGSAPAEGVDLTVTTRDGTRLAPTLPFRIITRSGR